MEAKTRVKLVRTSMPVAVGSTRVSQNGYHYTKVAESKWRLTHHIVAEKRYGRKIREGERVTFKDKDRTNLKPDNIEIVSSKNKKSNAALLARLYAKRDDLNAQIAELEEAEHTKSL